MAINQNTSHPNRNTLYIATSGGGKSQALFQNPEIPNKGVRVILWDPSHDHLGQHFDDKGSFVRAIAGGIKSGRGFRIAYSGGNGPDDYDWFCDIVWKALDGDHITYVISEELSAVCQSTAKASPNAARLLNQMRKYGGVFHGTTQKPQEVSKTFYDQCEVLHIGRQRNDNVRKMAKLLGVNESEIDTLQPLEFFKLDPALNNGRSEKYQLQYKKIPEK